MQKEEDLKTQREKDLKRQMEDDLEELIKLMPELAREGGVCVRAWRRYNEL